MGLTLILSVLVSAALMWGAISDLRSGVIPYGSGYGMLALGLLFLLKDTLWLEALFFIVAIWGSRGGMWRLLILLIAVVLLAEEFATLPFVAGMLYVLAIFWLGWFGGGDAQLAFGLIAIGRDWWILGYLFGGTIILGILLTIIRRGGIAEGAKRLLWVLKHISDPPDEEAIRMPWGVLAALGGMVYIWLWPGLMAGGG